MVKAAQLAEAGGFDSVWVNDHVVVPTTSQSAEAGDRQAQYLDRRRQKILEPLILLSFLAAATNEIRLGTSVYALALRNAVVAAKQISTLDHLSRGRVTLGVGVGWMEGEFDAIGIPFKERGIRTNEALEVLKTLWTAERPEFHGRNYNFSDIEFHPRPLQQPHPPLWIGGRTLIGARRAARFGDAWHPSHLTCREITEWGPRLATLCEQHGRAMNSVQITTRRRLIPFVAPAACPDERRTLQGSADEIADELQQLAAAGVTDVVVEFAATTESELLEAIDWTGREVLTKGPFKRSRL